MSVFHSWERVFSQKFWPRRNDSLPSIPHTIRYLHATAGFPVKETWLNAIKAGNYVTWPGVTTTAVRKHFPESDETQQGHMKKQ